MTDNLFFKLIQNAAGTADGFGPVVPSAEEWVAMYKDAQKQTLPGVCFAGVQRICSRHPEQAVKLPTNLKMIILILQSGTNNVRLVLKI